MTIDWRATAAALAFGGALALAGPATAQDTTAHLLSYEALPSVQVDVDFDPATYDQRAAITAEALDTVMPQVFDILGVDPAATETMVTPGGYLLNTNASLQTEATVDGATADRIAAAAGWVFRQWSVLVTDFGATDGGTGYAVVSFADGTLDADLAQAFFEHAAAVAEGLGGGYTAFGDAMYFLNVRGPDGPYSGIEDADFIDLLDEAAGSFAAADPAVTESGEAEARFVGNDWEAAPDGGAYLALLGGADSDTVAALTPVREAWTDRILAIAEENGWR
jgi:hypothetical protein